MRIGVDLDGVVYDYATPFTAYMRKVLHNPDLAYPNCWHFYQDQWGLTLEEFLSHMQDAVTAKAIFHTGDPIAGSVKALTALREQGHEIHIVTNRPQRGADRATKNWLDTHQIPHDSLTFSEDKTVVPVDVFLDDRPENYDSLVARGVTAVLFDQPWNRRHTGIRVSSWAEFRMLIMAHGSTEEVRVTSETGGQKGTKPIQLGSVDALALEQLGLVAGYGARKYERFNYLRGYGWSLNIDALLRHLLAFMRGEDLDPESGLPHTAHVAWHGMALTSFLLRGIGTDDRFKG